MAANRMGRTGNGAVDKIHRGKGAPRTREGVANSSNVPGVGESARRRSAGGVELGHLQMPIPRFADEDLESAPPLGASLGRAANVERVASHSKATTSTRCGFQWLETKLKREKEAWMLNDQNEVDEPIDEFNDYTWHYKHKVVPRCRLPHIIGRGGRMLQKLENFLGVFAFIREQADQDPKIVLVGERHSILLGEFIVDMIVVGHFGIMESLVNAGF